MCQPQATQRAADEQKSSHLHTAMTRTPPIQPILEEGIDRKVLATLRARFLALSAARLERAMQGLSTRQQQAVQLLPLLFHVNHPLLPGYVSASTPAGLSGFEPDAELLAEAQRLTRSFTYKPLRGRPAQPIWGLYLMGSLGTVAQEEHSDLDVWVCHDPALDARQLDELRRKCDLLTAWAASLGSEAHFFLVDPQRFVQGQRETQLTSDDCGTTQHYLLLDEFYRTAIWLGGRTPVWWLVPAYEEHRYHSYVDTLLERRFVRAEDVLDLGHLQQIPPGEFVGAGLWQLYKAIEAPYKSLFKLLLVEVYASQHPQVHCLALAFKQAVYAGQLKIEELDPYICAYRAIEQYLRDRDAPERLELARRCLYLKVNRPLSRPPRNRNKSWQRVLLEQLVRDWQWDERLLVRLDDRSRWKVRQVIQERQALANELALGYRFLSDFTRLQQAASSVSRRDLSVLGRRLFATIERKVGKVEVLNIGISPNMAEDSLTLVHGEDAAGDLCWSLFTGSLNAQEWANFVPLKRTRELIPLLAWCHRNGVIDAGTRVSLFAGDSGLSELELFNLLSELRQALPLPLPPVDAQTLLATAQPRTVLLLVNVGLDPLDQRSLLQMPEDGAHSDPLGYAAARENLVLSIDQVQLSSWNELIVSRYEGPHALPDCLRDHLQSLPADAVDGLPQLQVRCFSRNRGQAIARRVEELLLEARLQLASVHSRYLLQVRQQFHLLERRPDSVRATSLNDRTALLAHLGEAHHVYRPLRLDRHALKGDDLRLILPLARPDCLQLFYRVRGETAELSILDECNALWCQRLPCRDEQQLLMPLLRFLRSVEYRRNARVSLHGDDGEAAFDIQLYRLHGDPGEPSASVERRPLPQGGTSDACYEVQAIVEPGETRSQVTLYCNHREFSELEYGARLCIAVAEHILSQRRDGERYPCYITDLDLSGMHGSGRSQTVQLLRYKARLEAALNAALAQL